MTRGSSTPRAHPRSNSPCRLTCTPRKLQSRSPPMLLVARKNLFAERTRLGISVGGVALSVFLIGILLSLYRGWSQQVGGFVEHVPADLWATSDGTTDFVAAGSVLPDSLGVQLKLLPEVDVVDRKSTRLNSSHDQISYAVFCLKKKKQLAIHDRAVSLARLPAHPEIVVSYPLRKGGAAADYCAPDEAQDDIAEAVAMSRVQYHQ